MQKPCDECDLLGYILGALEDDAEQEEVSRRLAQDVEFHAVYRKLLKSMRPFLMGRESEQEVARTHDECEGLASRTMDFIMRAAKEQEVQNVPGEKTLTGVNAAETAMNQIEETVSHAQPAEKSEEELV